jgi:hypothetical protein
MTTFPDEFLALNGAGAYRKNQWLLRVNCRKFRLATGLLAGVQLFLRIYFG